MAILINMVDKSEKIDEFGFDSLSGMVDQPHDAEDSDVDFNCLQQAFDTSWGRSSTPKTSQYSVKFQLAGANQMIASYAAIVNFASDQERVIQRRRYAEESVSVINAHIKMIKDRYKKLSGKSLNVKEVATQDDVEVINMNFYNPKRTAYVRRRTVFEIA